MSFTVDLNLTGPTTLKQSDILNKADWDGTYYYTFDAAKLNPVPSKITKAVTGDGRSACYISAVDASTSQFSLGFEGAWTDDNLVIEYEINHSTNVAFWCQGLDLRAYLEKMGLPTDNVDIQKLVSAREYEVCDIGTRPKYSNLTYSLADNEFGTDQYISSSYPWLGSVKFNPYLFEGQTKKFLLAGTRPLAGTDSNHFYEFLTDRSLSYLLLRTYKGIYIYKGAWSIENSSYVLTTDGNSLAEICAADKDFFEALHEECVPIRLGIIATGGGGSGGGGGLFHKGGGGGGGGTAFGILDLSAYPAYLIKIGNGGSYTKEYTGNWGENTVISGLTELPVIIKTSNEEVSMNDLDTLTEAEIKKFKFSSNTTLTELLIGYGGEGGKEKEDASGGTFWVNSDANVFTLNGGGANGGTGKTAGNKGGASGTVDGKLCARTFSGNKAGKALLSTLCGANSYEGGSASSDTGGGGGGSAFGIGDDGGGKDDGVGYPRHPGHGGGGGYYNNYGRFGGNGEVIIFY